MGNSYVEGWGTVWTRDKEKDSGVQRAQERLDTMIF